MKTKYSSTIFPITIIILITSIAYFLTGCGEKKMPAYKNPELTIETRVTDLLSRMTLEEKIAQLQCVIADLEDTDVIEKQAIGNIGTVLRSYPAEEAAGQMNRIQKIAIEKTRLGIPILMHDEALHGLVGNRATSFPQAIGLAATWNTELMEKVATAIARETKSRGIRQVLSPVVNISRDVRWGRVEESYGEDPYLTARMGVAFCKSFEKLDVITTPKHYVANLGDGGRDSNPVHFTERLLREIYFPGFKACFQEGNAASVMAAYNSYDGTPCSSNKWLLSDILRNEWGFTGFVVSDYGSVGGILDLHHTAADKKHAAKQAIEAGMDIELPNIYIYGEPLLQAVNEGLVSESTIDRSVRRILTAKFKLGLFDNPYVDPDEAKKINDSKEHRELALRAAREAIVLLKNDDHVLPLDKNLKSIAVIGPFADVVKLGGYSGFGMKTVSILEGITDKVSAGTKITFEKGCEVGMPRLPQIQSEHLIPADYNKTIQQAAQAAKNADAVVLCLGILEGEGRDRASLDLPGKQEELIHQVTDTGKPTVVVLIGGSAVTMLDWKDEVPAIVAAWYPGEEGGNAVADVLFGEYNPAGRLPITFPQSAAQCPLYYNTKPSGRGYDYIDMTGKPLFPFGHGLSYTGFEYSNIKIEQTKIKANERASITVDVKNIGKRAGEEVAQLYLHDLVGSVSRPLKELKGFKRIFLKPGKKKTIEFELMPDDLSMLDINLNWIVEPGEFEVMIGSSAEDIRLRGRFEVVK